MPSRQEVASRPVGVRSCQSLATSQSPVRPMSRTERQVEPARECDDSGEREGREPGVPLVNPAPEQVDADAEGVAVELEHRHRVAYRPERCADEG